MIIDQQGGKSEIPPLKEMDGSVITNRERIVKRCAEFCQSLYEDNIDVGVGVGVL